MHQPDLYAEAQISPDILQSRKVALALLEVVLGRRMPLDQALDENRDLPNLPVRDRAFVRMLVATTLRRLGQIDALIRQATDRGEPPSPPVLHHILRLGIAQILFMNVPDHAAVDTAVRLAETAGLSRQKGFVNAVLRRITREGRDWLAKQDDARLNLPEWLMSVWIADYGLKTAADMAQASLSEAPLDITLKDPAHTLHWSGMLEASVLPTGSLRRAAGGNVQELPGYHDGMWWIQDAAAAIPAKLFGPLQGKTVVDLCAAPGGKSAQLAAGGASVIALDRSARRIQRLEENIRRLRLDKNVTTEAADAAVWKPKIWVDAVLLDAPCSATGTIRRHPDVLHAKTPEDVERLTELQARLLENAASMLETSGILVYCTCSLQKAEGEAQIESFLHHHPEMKRLPITAEDVPGVEESLTAEGDLRILPMHLAAHGGMDGFYIARLVKG
ncbi:MAG: 16S rRNA (cytosine(967)-C(5))-methyltransferase RsmB [Micavibrio aeruginosavorus]|nr:16S rRNA (cytosine(967)-C(5))-methyltransferase RsmB [Micavibrio aeruginosavorus]